METVGNNIIELSSEAALVVVLAQALVLFIFSSSGLSSLFVKIGLPPIPMIPVSSSQVIVGCILGIGLYKGAKNVNFKVLGEIATGWIATPVASGVLAYFSLFFMKNIFNIDVGSYNLPGITEIHKTVALAGGMDLSQVFRYILLTILISGIIITVIYFLYERKRRIGLQRSEEKFWMNMK